MIEIIPNWHPIFVHFTVALLSLSVICFVIQRPLAETIIGDNFLIVARYSLWLGVLMSIVTVIAGWDAYNTVNHDDLSHAAMTEHRNWGLATFALFAFLGLWWKIVSGIDEKASLIFILCLLIGAGLLGSTTYKGSQLVFKFGLGVQSLPSKDDHTAGGLHGDGHDHAHSNTSADHHDTNNSHKSSNKDSGEKHSHDSLSDSDHHLSSHESIEHSHDSIQIEEQETSPIAKDEANADLHKAEPDVSSVNEPQSSVTTIAKPTIKTPATVVDEPAIKNVTEVVNTPKTENKPKVTDEPKVESTPVVVDKPKAENKPKVADKPKVESAPVVVDKPKAENKPKIVDKPKVESAPVVVNKPKAESKPEVTDKPKVISSPETEVTDNAKAEDTSESTTTDEVITDEVITDEDNTFIIPQDENNTFLIP